jgi:L-ascorbate metabolism protein UlaG (beta-lactamase superfamily)
MNQQYKAKITYLFHSGFSVETANNFLIFDYYHPSLLDRKNNDGKIVGQDLKNKQNVYVFASHSHPDHFDSVILSWDKENPSINYIFSDDITLNSPKKNYRFLAPYQTVSDPSVQIKTFGSTDIGLSFLVETDGLSIFHAGDLNWWHWKGESQKEQEYAAKAFKAEMEKIAGQQIDIAFFPVDRRLEEFYSLGAEYFMGHVRPGLLVPMHFGKDFAATENFAAKVKNISNTVAVITHLGQEIYFK